MHARPESGSVETPNRLRQSVIIAGLFLFTYAVHALSPVTTSTDSAWTFHLAASMLREHNVDLDEYSNLIDLKLDYRLRAIRGHIYYYYPIATPLLVTPVVWTVNLLYPLSHTTDFYTYLSTHGPDDRTARLEKLAASGFVALATFLMYLVARRYVSSLQAVVIAFVFAFSTSMWSTGSRALWQHGPSVLFLALALYLTIVVSDRSLAVLCTGLILGFAYLIRPTNSLSIAFIGLYYVVVQRRKFALYALGVLAVLLPYGALNWHLYGNLFPPYSYQLFERLGSPAAIGEGLVGTIVSPGRGLFVFTPVFLFSVYGAYVAMARGAASLRSLEPYLAAIVVAHWITTSLFEDWGGAWSIGPRYFVDIIPYLTFFLIPLFQWHVFTKPAIKSAFVAAVIVSTLIQLHSATSIYPFMWNGKPQALVDAPGRKWDWGDLQFLRGYCRDNPPEGRAPACWTKFGG
jgi:hypothetical protein